jgi:hypothetical protein
MNYQKLQDATPKTGNHVQVGQSPNMYTYTTQSSNDNLSSYGSAGYNTAAYPQFKEYSGSGHQQQNNYGYNGYNGGYGNGQGAGSKLVYESKAYKEDYFNKKIENAIIKRSAVTGSLIHGYTEFDDYFEKHVEKFFTPEMDELYLYYHEGYIFGLQAAYRDSWGKTNKETYKGEIHMANGVTKENCQRLKLKMSYDEYIKEAYIEAGEYVTFLKFVTNLGQTIQVGQQMGTPKNILPEQSKILGIGGTHNICLNSIYFYYT